MGNFKRDNKKSGGGFNRGFGGRDRDKPNMHKATCDECGKDCQVPFRPTGERPVYCSDCFKGQGGGGGRPNKFGDKRRERSDFRDKQMHEAVCAKCGKDCQVPFRPTDSKPVFCDDCFKQDGNKGKDSGEIMQQLNLLNVKIDKLMEMLAPKVSIEKTKEKAKKPKVEKKAAVKKAVKEKKEKTKVKSAKKKASTKKKK